MIQLLEALTEERYESIQKAVELGKWADGRLLEQEESARCLQLLIAYDKKNKPETERVGYLPKKVKP